MHFLYLVFQNLCNWDFDGSNFSKMQLLISRKITHWKIAVRFTNWSLKLFSRNKVCNYGINEDFCVLRFQICPVQTCINVFRCHMKHFFTRLITSNKFRDTCILDYFTTPNALKFECKSWDNLRRGKARLIHLQSTNYMHSFYQA